MARTYTMPTECVLGGTNLEDIDQRIDIGVFSTALAPIQDQEFDESQPCQRPSCLLNQVESNVDIGVSCCIQRTEPTA